MNRGLEVATTRHRNLLFPASEYVFGIAHLNLSNKTNGDETDIRIVKLRRIQKVVVADFFSGCIKRRFGTPKIMKGCCITSMNNSHDKQSIVGLSKLIAS